MGSSLRLRLQHTRSAAIIASMAIPPTTPPAIAAVRVLLLLPDVEETSFAFPIVCEEFGESEDEVGLMSPSGVMAALSDDVV